VPAIAAVISGAVVAVSPTSTKTSPAAQSPESPWYIARPKRICVTYAAVSESIAAVAISHFVMPVPATGSSMLPERSSTMSMFGGTDMAVKDFPPQAQTPIMQVSLSAQLMSSSHGPPVVFVMQVPEALQNAAAPQSPCVVHGASAMHVIVAGSQVRPGSQSVAAMHDLPAPPLSVPPRPPSPLSLPPQLQPPGAAAASTSSATTERSGWNVARMLASSVGSRTGQS
jgi:hypothetical protein